MKSLIKALVLLSLTTGSAFASQGTGIFVEEEGTAVQCNNWGWTDQYSYTVWLNTACTPLQVKTVDQVVYTVPSSAGVCKDDQIAVYEFNQGDSEISFDGCMPGSISNKQILKSSRK